MAYLILPEFSPIIDLAQGTLIKLESHHTFTQKNIRNQLKHLKTNSTRTLKITNKKFEKLKRKKVNQAHKMEFRNINEPEN